MDFETLEGQFPNTFETPKEKDSHKYILEYAQTLWADAQTQSSTINLEERTDRWINNRKYSEGTQSVEKFKPMFSSTGDITYLNMNWAVSTPLPKLAETLRGQMLNQPFKIEFKPVDSTSLTDLDKKRRELRAKMELRKLAPQLEQKGYINLGDNLPEDDDELEIILGSNFKVSQSIAMEALTEAILQDNDFYSYIQPKIAKDLVDLKWYAAYVGLDENNLIKIEYIDPVKLVTSYVVRDDFKDAKHIGVIADIPIEDLRVQAAGQLGEKELFDIAKSCAGKYSNGNFPYADRQYYSPDIDYSRYNRFNVKVLTFEFFSADPLTSTKIDSANGGRRVLINEAPRNSKAPRKTSTKTVKNVYQAKYVIGTNYLYDYGLKKNMIRERINGKYSTNTVLGFIVGAPDIFDMENLSKVEAAIPDAEMIILILLKAQQFIAKAKPSGYLINEQATQAALVGMGFGGMKPIDARAITDQIGDIYFREFTEDGRPITQHASPVTPLPNGLDNSLQILALEHNQTVARMKENMGLNNAVDAGQPDKRAAVGVQKLAAAAHKQVNKTLYDAYIRFNEEVARQVSILAQQLIRKGVNLDKFENMIGKEFVKEVGLSKLAAADFAINVKMLPDEEGKAYLDSLIQLQFTAQPPRIDLSDVIAVRTAMEEDLQKAEQLLLVRERRRKKERQKESELLQQQNAQVQIQSMQAAEQAKQATLQMEMQMKSQLEQAKQQAELMKDMTMEEERRKTLVLEAELDMQRLEKAAALKAQEGGGYDKERDSTPKLVGKVEPAIATGTQRGTTTPSGGM